jgi:hypothetical protein
LQVRQCAYGIADHDTAVIENFLEFPGGFNALVCSQTGLATYIDRVEGPEQTLYAGVRLAQFIGNCDLQQFDSL